MMKNRSFLQDEDQNGVPKPAFCWWKMLEEFDEHGNFKVEISDISSLTPRVKVLREMERLALVSVEGLDDFRHKLLSYRAGDFWLPVGGIKKEDIDIPPIVTILLVGLVSSGKSSLINLMYSVLGRSGLIPFAQTSGESSRYTTMYLEEHNVLRSPRSGLCVFDTRGLDGRDQIVEGLDEVSTWMADGVKHNQPCYRSGDDRDCRFKGSTAVNNSRFVKRKVNCVMVVADLAQIVKAFKYGDLKSIEALRALFCLECVKNSNENPILILTHGDSLTPDDRVGGRVKICEYLGIPETSGAYDVACLTEQGILAEECDPVTAFALTEAVYRALLISDRSHLPKRKFKDSIIMFWYWIMSCIASFFAILADFFSKFGHQNKKLKM
ncbi:hypothetical protein C2S53_018194 [Perilla frutescens var. hirtella]|uniref:Uncharacterized protein n=1 Tax=Perilla frutescens var. hirtella TaxID=608512 RepID=A0AAD4JEL8_PERFH|nr:hypothetical protein C2S53_018194 [Perilla frutescens var. hirtella]